MYYATPKLGRLPRARTRERDTVVYLVVFYLFFIFFFTASCSTSCTLS